MNNLPTFSKLDADRILRCAAEIEGAEDTSPVTVAELRSIAGEAGFGAQAVERALAEAQQAAAMEVRRHPVQRSGIVMAFLWTLRTIPREISSEDVMQAVRLFQPYREGPAQVELEEDQITWRDRRGLVFRVSSGGGATEIRVSVSKILIRRGRWMGWVKAAADRLEVLVLLVASRDQPRPENDRIASGDPGAWIEAGPDR